MPAASPRVNSLTRQLDADGSAGRQIEHSEHRREGHEHGIDLQGDVSPVHDRRAGLDEAMDGAAVGAFYGPVRDQCVLPGWQGERDHFRALVVADRPCAGFLVGHKYR